MRCNICDKALTDTEVRWNKDLNTFEPCSICLEVALDAAYSNGFTPEEDQEIEEDIDGVFGDPVPVLDDCDTYRSVYDHCDTSLAVFPTRADE